MIRHLFKSKPVGKTALEVLESLSDDVSVEKKVFGRNKEIRVKFGEWGKQTINFWGTGETIEKAAEDVLIKICTSIPFDPSE